MFMLHNAARDGKLQVVEYLIGFDAQIDEKDKFQMTPLHFAAQFGRFEVTKFLVEKGAQINVKNEEGNTPLHEAAENDHPEIVKFLIDRGAQMEIKNESNFTPAVLGIHHPEVVQCFIEKGFIATSNSFFHLTITEKCFETFKYLVNNGANIHDENDQGSQPIHTAAFCNNHEVIKYLI